MGRLREAVWSHHVVAHTSWAAVWTCVLLGLAVVVGGEQPRASWVLAVPLLVGVFHVLFRVGRWADRRGATNTLTRRATVLAWVFPVAFPVFVVWDAVTA